MMPIESMNLCTSSVVDMGAQWIDLDNEGAPRVRTKIPEGGWHHQRNLTYDGEPRLGEPCLVSTTPNLSGSVKWDFEDINLDSHPDVIVVERNPGLHGF